MLPWIALVALSVIGLTLVLGFVYGVGYDDGQREGLDEALNVHMQAAQAQRDMHNLTREMFTAMAEKEQEQYGP